MNGLEYQNAHHQSYLWVVGPGVVEKPLNDMVQNRYRVVAPQIWLDTQPNQRPPYPDQPPAAALPYLRAHPQRLHVPGLHGVLGAVATESVLLLNNAPIHPHSGELLPAMFDLWLETFPLRQLNWLWQGWELWSALAALGVASSLLDLDNLRVDGWRLRLRELRRDRQPLLLSDLARAWRPLAEDADAAVRSQLLDLLVELENPDPAERFGQRLNQLLLKQAAHRRVRISLTGGTDPGPGLPRNEDACYPVGTLPPENAPRLAIVCDGVGGHAGGEIASHMAVQALQLQLQGLLSAARRESQLLPPQVVSQQIEAVLRVVNDIISHQNDSQGRVERQRMGTTVVMAVVVPQSVHTEAGWSQVEELYIVHVGDSRAYWITPDYCHLLTVDDDIAGREVAAARQPLPLALDRPDADALTQALGTRNADHLHPHIQRFIPEETGLLLLCSDGLSDNNRIEQSWANYIGLLVKGIVSLETSLATWIQLANQKNGHDNVSVVLMFCRTSASDTGAKALATQEDLLQSELTPSAEALLYGETADQQPAPASPPARRGVAIWVWVVIGVAIIAGGLTGWWLTRPPVTEPVPESTEQSRN